MPKLMRTLVLGAMLAVLSSATAAVAQEPTATSQAVQQFLAGERASLGQPVGSDDAVEQFRAGERASQAQAAPVPAPSAEPGTPVALLAALAAAAVLALSLDALAVRRKTRKTAAGAAT
jgi:hypothetical protein